jgi:ketosteroid isomerase-like protein
MATSTLNQPSLKQRVNDLVSYIQNGKILEAMTEFYAEGATMRENSNPPTVGLAANIEREKQFLAYVKQWKSLAVEAVGVDAERGRTLVQINFEFDAVDGKTVKYDQVAVQTWKDGKIVDEKFYYDSAK